MSQKASTPQHLNREGGEWQARYVLTRSSRHPYITELEVAVCMPPHAWLGMLAHVHVVLKALMCSPSLLCKARKAQLQYVLVIAICLVLSCQT